MKVVYRNVLIIFLGLTRVVLSQQIPEQVHISHGDSHDSMVIMWSSNDYVTWDVNYGISPTAMSMPSQSRMAQLPDTHFNAAKYIYRSVLQNLTLATTYFYKIASRTVKSPKAESQMFSFKTLPDDNEYNHVSRFIVYGDLGATLSGPTISAIDSLRQSKNIDAVFHIGDFAYDLHDRGGKIGDTFMQEIQTIAAELPYMTSPGNHEIPEDFKPYRTRFSTPNTPWPIPLDKMWYTFDVGLVHFISYSTEVYFTYNETYVCTQFDWLLQDLITANKNRDKRPWIIALGHRPMYCSNNNNEDCIGGYMRYWVKSGLESLFHAQGVDLVIEAHEHSYERLYPLFDGQVERFNYTNPKAPVHIITGAAGSMEGISGWKNPAKIWSAFRSTERDFQSYGILEIYNRTHILFTQIDAKENVEVDKIWITQATHGPFIENVRCHGPLVHASCYCVVV